MVGAALAVLGEETRRLPGIDPGKVGERGGGDDLLVQPAQRSRDPVSDRNLEAALRAADGAALPASAFACASTRAAVAATAGGTAGGFAALAAITLAPLTSMSDLPVKMTVSPLS